MIAYLRDFGLNFRFLAESFETSVAWDSVMVPYRHAPAPCVSLTAAAAPLQPLCNNVRERIKNAAAARGVTTQPFISCRVTQVRPLVGT
jgi:alkyldihydroxyacetonephosphate synthase